MHYQVTTEGLLVRTKAEVADLSAAAAVAAEQLLSLQVSTTILFPSILSHVQRIASSS